MGRRAWAVVGVGSILVVAILVILRPEPPRGLVCTDPFQGDVSLRLDAPEARDTLMLGAPLHVAGSVETTGRVEGVGVALVWAPAMGLLGAERRVLLQHPLSKGPGRYSFQFDLRTDSVAASVSADSLQRRGQVYVELYGEPVIDCGQATEPTHGRSSVGVPVVFVPFEPDRSTTFEP